jgi:hypothetical protein
LEVLEIRDSHAQLKRAALKEKYAEILKELYAKPVSLPAKL